MPYQLHSDKEIKMHTGCSRTIITLASMDMTGKQSIMKKCPLQEEYLFKLCTEEQESVNWMNTQMPTTIRELSAWKPVTLMQSTLPLMTNLPTTAEASCSTFILDIFVDAAKARKLSSADKWRWHRFSMEH